MQGAEQRLSALNNNYPFRYDNLTGAQRPALDALSTMALETAISRFSLDSISGLDAGLFEEIQRLGNQARAQELYDSFQTFAAIGQVGRDRLGTFAGGPKRVALDGALGLIGQDYTTI